MFGDGADDECVSRRVNVSEYQTGVDEIDRRNRALHLSYNIPAFLKSARILSLFDQKSTNTTIKSPITMPGKGKSKIGSYLTDEKEKIAEYQRRDGRKVLSNDNLMLVVHAVSSCVFNLGGL